MKKLSSSSLTATEPLMTVTRFVPGMPNSCSRSWRAVKTLSLSSLTATELLMNVTRCLPVMPNSCVCLFLRNPPQPRWPGAPGLDQAAIRHCGTLGGNPPRASGPSPTPPTVYQRPPGIVGGLPWLAPGEAVPRASQTQGCLGTHFDPTQLPEATWRCCGDPAGTRGGHPPGNSSTGFCLPRCRIVRSRIRWP